MTPTLLLVDDEPAIIDAIKSSLIDDHYTIFTAGCADEALSLLENHKIDVVISDNAMPGMSGLELCSHIHKHWPATHRILLTDLNQVVDISQGLSNGDIQFHLEKPWDAMLLRYHINEAIRQKNILFQALNLKTSFQQADQACFITDKNWIVLLNSPGAAKWLEKQSEDITGKNLFSPSISLNTIQVEAEINQKVSTQSPWQGRFLFNTTGIHGPEAWMCVVPFAEDHFLCLAIPFIDEMLAECNLSSSTSHQYSPELESSSFQASSMDHYSLELTIDHPNARDPDFITAINERIQLATDNLYLIFPSKEGRQLIQVPANISQTAIDNLNQSLHQAFIEPFHYHGHAQIIHWKTELLNLEQSAFALAKERNNHLSDNSDSRLTPVAPPITIQNKYRGHSYYQPYKYPKKGFYSQPIFNQQGQVIALMPAVCIHRDDTEFWLEGLWRCQNEWTKYNQQRIIWVNDFSQLKPHQIFKAIAAILAFQRQSINDSSHWKLIITPKQVNDMCHKKHPLEQLTRNNVKVLIKDPEYQLNTIKSLNQKLSDVFEGICMSQSWLFDKQQQLNRQGLQLLNHLDHQPLTLLALDIESTHQLALLHNSPCSWLSGEELSSKILPQQIAWLYQ